MSYLICRRSSADLIRFIPVQRQSSANMPAVYAIPTLDQHQVEMHPVQELILISPFPVCLSYALVI